jgi:multidrug efflux pump subunit AcrA (membrane-fusion protein)
LDSAIVALGKVKVQSKRKQIQHLEGGMVKTIVIQDGDRVEEGQLLLTLDATFANSDLDRVSAQWHELKIRESVLLAQRDRIRESYFPAEILHTAESSWINHQMVSAINGFKISEIEFKSLRVQQDYREKAAKELAEVQLNLNDSSKRMGVANNVLKRIEIRSPVSGTILGLNIHTLGAVIKPGMPSEVLIKTGESTPLQYLMEPLLSAFRTAWRDQ